MSSVVRKKRPSAEIIPSLHNGLIVVLTASRRAVHVDKAAFVSIVHMAVPAIRPKVGLKTISS